MRTIEFVQGGGLAIAVAILRPRVLPRKTGQFVEWSAFRELEYTSYACGSVLVSYPLHGQWPLSVSMLMLDTVPDGSLLRFLLRRRLRPRHPGHIVYQLTNPRHDDEWRWNGGPTPAHTSC